MSVLALLLAASAAAAPRPEARFEKAARAIVDVMNAGEYRELTPLLDPGMRKAFPVEKRREVFDDLRRAYGDPRELGPARVKGAATALVPLKTTRGRLLIEVTLDDENLVSGLYFRPFKEEVPAPARNLVELRPPFRGRWLVFWGGDTPETNAHLKDRPQRAAFDFLGADDEGRTRRGKGAGNADYHCWGREILAPADGVVVEAISGVRDNEPGSMNPYSAVGNAVILEHAKSHYSLLAHLQDGSVRVRRGQAVKTGEVLGLCGNSGNSSEPHLHYHLQNTPVLQDGTGIKAYFSGLGAEPRSPVKGDLLLVP